MKKTETFQRKIVKMSFAILTICLAFSNASFSQNGVQTSANGNQYCSFLTN